MAQSGRLASLNVARASAVSINGRRVMTGIGKRPVDGPRAVLPLGIEGDEQADLTVHGGLSKAVYGLSGRALRLLADGAGAGRDRLVGRADPPGSLGENLTVAGVVESEVFIGDVLRFPGCALAVSEPRYPCFKFNAAMGFKHAGKLMVQSGWCGWYLAVREPGTIAAGETFAIEPGPRQVGIAEIFRARTGRA
jgi:MOSC domain-containing protein YiiM